ncbi:hypothetical protein Dsin_017067 [Dipteronia sinensis]|uniref:Uncharacterized protein n=1 Tax=Dipteronia sinensis TaxID=43782 RepID=A0AAE0E630_9ROSI|nr:hypothetical protein Dsin_017067 [Dipteronia sinensis]
MAGRVIGLDLSLESMSDRIGNSSGLFALKHLQSLNLAYNYFEEAQIPSRLANLANLPYLNLSKAGVGGEIPIEISSMTRLVTLDLSTFYTRTLLADPDSQLKSTSFKTSVSSENYILIV